MALVSVLFSDNDPNSDLPSGYPSLVRETVDNLPSADWVIMEYSEVLSIRETKKAEYIAYRDGIRAAENAEASLRISFEEMPIKLPGLAWQVIEGLGLTKAQRKALIRGLSDFYVFVQSGHIALGVEALNEASLPPGVPLEAWDALKAQVNYVIGLNS